MEANELTNSFSERDGSYVKFSITLEKQSVCSQIILEPFTKYPVEIISVKYEEDTETYHTPKELVQHATHKESSGQIRIAFPSVLAKRFTITMNQKNYERNSYMVRKNSLENQEIWRQILAREAKVTLDLGDGLETVETAYLDEITGWNMYLAAVEKFKKDLQVWKDKMVIYEREYAAYQAAQAAARRAEERYQRQQEAYESSYSQWQNTSPTQTKVLQSVSVAWDINADTSRPTWDQGFGSRVTSTTKNGYVTEVDRSHALVKTAVYKIETHRSDPPSAPSSPNISYPQQPVSPGPEPTFTFETQYEEVKYEYLQGLRDLRISGEEYGPKAMYLSKPIDVPGNIIEASLSSMESHPLFDEISGEASSRQTSVEYYVSYETNPSLEDWHAILPEDQKEVLAELLIFGSGSKANLRFPSIPIKEGAKKATVYKDGVPLLKEKWSFANGGRQVQLLETYVTSAIYTINYTPNTDLQNPWIVNIAQDKLKRIRQVDVFPTGTNRNKTVLLSNYPYINYELINQDPTYNANTSAYKPVKVKIKDANIAGPNRTTFKEIEPWDGTTNQNVFTKNITDYKTSSWKPLTPYSISEDSKYNGFDYLHEQNKLYFSETFNFADIRENLDTNHGNGAIEVEYEYLVSSFRVKIILRRNGAGMNSITPTVHSYALKFKSMN